MTDEPTNQDTELLRQVLHEEGARVNPTPDWDDVRERGQSRRKWWIPTAAALVLVALVTAAAFALRSDDDDRGVIADEPDRAETTTTTAPSTTTTTEADGTVEAGPEVEPLDLPAGEPLGDDEMVASIRVPGAEIPEVEIVVISTSSGEVVRTLATGYDSVEGGVYGFALTPDRRTALYSVSTAACTARIEAVAVDGTDGPVDVADNGNHVAVSPDGSAIAIETGDICVSPPSVDVLPVDGGESTRYPSLGSGRGAMESMAFADDDTLLFATAAHEPGELARLQSLDLSTGVRTQVRPTDDRTQYTALDRRGDVVTALESSDGGHHLVTLEGGSVTDRTPVAVDDPRAVEAIGFDGDGAVVIVEGFETVTVDGRLIRDDVLDAAF